MDNKQSALELGQKPVGGLLVQYALPAIVAMTASSLYNIIDRAFIGQMVGPEARWWGLRLLPAWALRSRL